MGGAPRRGWFDVRPPRGGVAFYAGCLIFFPIMVLVLSDDVTLRYISSFMLAVGVGLWLKHSWARWVAFTFFSAVLVLLSVRLALGEFTTRNFVKLMVLMSTLYMLWEWDVWPADASDTTYDDEEYPYQEQLYPAEDEEYEVDDEEEYDDQEYEEENYESAEDPWEEEDDPRSPFSPWRNR